MIRLLNFLRCHPGTRALLTQIQGQLTTMEDRMSELSDATAKLTASVDAANDRITTLIQPLQTALAAAQSQLADLEVQDQADKADLEASLTDATTATSSILAEVSKVDTFATTTPDPTPDPTPAS